MIYFLQRQSDDLITFGLTNDVNATIIDIEAEYGPVELLGVMPGDEAYHDNLWQEWGVYHKEEEYEWILSLDEIIEYP